MARPRRGRGSVSTPTRKRRLHQSATGVLQKQVKLVNPKKNVVLANETQINFYQNDERRIWRQEETAQDPKLTTSSLKHAGGNVLA